MSLKTTHPWRMVLIIISLIILLLWVFIDVSHEEKNKVHVPDAFMQQITQYQYNADGSLKHDMQAHLMQHYPKQDSSYFTQLNIQLFTKRQRVWQITADRGRSFEGSKQVLLTGHVIFHQQAGNRHPETTIRTSRARLKPQQQYISTHQPTALTRPGILITCIGMNANLEHGIITLKNNVKATYNENLHTS